MRIIRFLVITTLSFALTCGFILGPAVASAQIGLKKGEVEHQYGDYCFVQDGTGRFWTQNQWRTMPGAVAKYYGYRPKNLSLPLTVWVEYNKQNVAIKETVIMDNSVKIRDFKNFFGDLHSSLIAADSKAYLIQAFPKDQLAVVVPQGKDKLMLVRFFPAEPDDKTCLNMHTRINGFETITITTSAIKKNLASGQAAPCRSEGKAISGNWVQTENFFRPELYFSEKLRPRKLTDMIVIHHTKIENMSVADIHELHLKKGWAGVGYHKVILPDGTVEDARPEVMTGAHALGANDRSLGLVLVGDFETSRPTPRQLAAAIDLTLQLMKKYHIELANVVPHCTVTPGTICPGPLFPWDLFVQELQARVSK